MRTALISAIAGCTEERQRKKARRFLQGLSSDELQYIAEFLGACLLECSEPAPCSRRQLADGIAHFGSMRSAAGGLNDQEHKMILLLEYLCHCKLTHCSLAHQAGRTGI